MTMPLEQSAVGKLAVAVFFVFLAPWVSAQERFLAAEASGVPNQYLIVLENEAARGPGEDDLRPSVAEVAADLAILYGGEVERTWDHAIKGFQLRTDADRAQRLASDAAVRWVHQDRQITHLVDQPLSCYGFDDPPAEAPLPPQDLGQTWTQNIVCDDPDPQNPNRNCVDNWGLDRIDQTSGNRDDEYTYSNVAHSVQVFVLDTGIHAGHHQFIEFGPPFTRVVNGYNAILNGDPANTTDCHGHGTHVAGIIGGGTTGVAKDVFLRPVKFVDTCSGTITGGTVTDVLNGLEWILANHDPSLQPAVVNWSGGNGSAAPGETPHSNDPAIRQAVANLLAAGFSFVQAAGNQLDDLNGQPTDACARSLGGVPGLEAVIVVGGTDVNQSGSPIDGRWVRESGDPSGELCDSSPHKDCGSNSGTCVDLWAPAAHIVSADADNVTGVCRLSGTSMAAPHVTGAVALYLQANPSASPDQVRQALLDGATCGVLDDNPSSPYYIGDGSPNLLLNSLFAGGGTAPCSLEDIAEVGKVSLLTHGPQTVLLSRSYDQPVVIAQPPSFNDSDTAVVRITNVQSDRFTFYIDEAPDRDGSHGGETVTYLVMEAGSWKLLDGSELRAGTLTTSKTVGASIANSWATVSYGGTFTKVPVVLSQVQSNEDASWVKTRHRAVGNSSFQVAMEEEEASTTAHGTETVGWIALAASNGTWSGHAYRFSRTKNRVTHDWFTLRFKQLGDPHFLAAMQTYDGGQNAALRYRNLLSTSVQIKVEEDTTLTPHVAHTTEVVDFVLLSGSGVLQGIDN